MPILKPQQQAHVVPWEPPSFNAVEPYPLRLPADSRPPAEVLAALAARRTARVVPQHPGREAAFGG